MKAHHFDISHSRDKRKMLKVSSEEKTDHVLRTRTPGGTRLLNSDTGSWKQLNKASKILKGNYFQTRELHAQIIECTPSTSAAFPFLTSCLCMWAHRPTWAFRPVSPPQSPQEKGEGGHVLPLSSLLPTSPVVEESWDSVSTSFLEWPLAPPSSWGENELGPFTVKAVFFHGLGV